jgi:hypothetical protein
LTAVSAAEAGRLAAAAGSGRGDAVSADNKEIKKFARLLIKSLRKCFYRDFIHFRANFWISG